MGRRSDHSREELREIAVTAGHRHMDEVGFAHFSAREVAKRIGYSIGTIYNVFGSYDALILAINGRTLALWRDHLLRRLSGVQDDRLRHAIIAYFEFATNHRHAWAAIYDFRLPEDCTPPDSYQAEVRAIFDIVIAEVRQALPPARKCESEALTRSLLASVHGHCVFAMNGTFAMLGETSPVDAALCRVRDSVGSLMAE
ncbi:TetR/AcrR family transcriptional regulator [Novosphingobium sp. MMS21-SN21R]|uniref:TetR/AcrR family transcriptional regulator n=1 Tax=Novosphingobium sp. MMS21-SN21R TaxID=2969298 RepID=UPI0028872FAF|nr:TetR/AcrR family transcriptional regulator [Novosphingobium sp. MMS21-SN21R]MDT0508572.1 TetR/AcrR family transcriptional regulator [Novosphingobium sp. MMS21-SN21R]